MTFTSPMIRQHGDRYRTSQQISSGWNIIRRQTGRWLGVRAFRNTDSLARRGMHDRQLRSVLLWSQHQRGQDRTRCHGRRRRTVALTGEPMVDVGYQTRTAIGAARRAPQMTQTVRRCLGLSALSTRRQALDPHLGGYAVLGLRVTGAADCLPMGPSVPESTKVSNPQVIHRTLHLTTNADSSVRTEAGHSWPPRRHRLRLPRRGHRPGPASCSEVSRCALQTNTAGFLERPQNFSSNIAP